jgi:Uma2 family endonuclease
MTMTVSVPRHDPWTIDDLHDIPDDGNRYEIADGRLLVSPAPATPHARCTERLRRLLDRQAPAELAVIAVGLGVDITQRTTYYVPDIVVVRTDAIERDTDTLSPADVPLVVEVLSPSNARIDLVLKRHDYAMAGIPQYWIVDPKGRTLTVLSGDGYRDEQIIRAGEKFAFDRPFPVTLDPADFT